MPDRILLIMAKRAGRWIAGAINFIGSRHAVRPPLGRDRAPPVPAFRGLLLPGDRIRHRAQARARRGRRPGRAQARARLSAGHHLFGALHRRSGRCAARSPTISSASAPMWKRPARSLRRRRRSARIWSSRNRIEVLRETTHAELRSAQHLRQNPARRTAVPQGLRGRQGARLPRHHAARARPHAGAAEGAGAQPARRRARRPRRSHQGRAEDRQGRR